MKSVLTLLLGIAGMHLAQAADITPPEVPPPLPPEPAQGRSLETEPQVTITKEADRTIQEVRINGRLRYVKITPNSGPPYYIIDTDGDGQVDTRRDDLDNPPINQWILKRW